MTRSEHYRPGGDFSKLPSFDPTRIMSVRGAAYASGIHQDTIRKWIREGKLRAYGKKGHYRVCLGDVLPVISPENP
ncbi:MAG TPA: helix-turn-helix domain-containing protein [Bryobacteraceae bacterium]|nr:helix-turn-helix domain-containing protein [Bryobacteraceae bacterium]